MKLFVSLWISSRKGCGSCREPERIFMVEQNNCGLPIVSLIITKLFNKYALGEIGKLFNYD